MSNKKQTETRRILMNAPKENVVDSYLSMAAHRDAYRKTHRENVHLKQKISELEKALKEERERIKNLILESIVDGAESVYGNHNPAISPTVTHKKDGFATGMNYAIKLLTKKSKT